MNGLLRSAIFIMGTGLLLAVAGCAGGNNGAAESTSEPGTEPATTSVETEAAQDEGLDHAEFVARADELCRRGRLLATSLEKRMEPLVDADDYDGLADARDEFFNGEELGEIVAELEALEPPPEDEAAFSKFLSLQRQMDALAGRVTEAARERDFEEALRLTALIEDMKDEQRIGARDLGLSECAG